MDSPDMNPFQELRIATGHDRTAFAAAMGMPYSLLYSLERGRPVAPPEKLMSQLADLGYDTADLSRRYAIWRSHQIEAIRDSIREKAPA